MSKQQFLNQSKLPNRFAVEFETFSKFTWLDRLKVLVGYNAVVRTAVRVDKRTGQAWQMSVLTLTPLKDEKDVIAQQTVLDMGKGAE